MAIISRYGAVVLMLILKLITSADEQCWIDYQSGLDNAPGKAKEAARVTNGESCYEVGVRNGALWQLQALAVANQCLNENLFSDHWIEEDLPESNIKQLIRPIDQITNGAASNTLKSLKKSFVPKTFLKRPEEGNVQDRGFLESPQRPLSSKNADDADDGDNNAAGGRVFESEAELREEGGRGGGGIGRDDERGGRGLAGMMSSSSSDTDQIRSEPPPQSSLSVRDPSSDRAISSDPSPSINTNDRVRPAASHDNRMMMMLGDHGRFIPALMDRAQQAGFGSGISSRKIEEQRLIRTGSDSNMNRSNTRGNSLLIPSQSTPSTSRSTDPTSNGPNQGIDPGSAASLDEDRPEPEQEITVRTLQSDTKTIV